MVDNNLAFEMINKQLAKVNTMLNMMLVSADKKPVQMTGNAIQQQQKQQQCCMNSRTKPKWQNSWQNQRQHTQKINGYKYTEHKNNHTNTSIVARRMKKKE